MTLKKQVAGTILSPDWIANPKKADSYIRQMAEHGYTMVDLFVRHMHYSVLDKAVHDAVGHIVKSVHHHGMCCILDTDHEFWGKTVAEKYPESALQVIVGVEVQVYDGRFDFPAYYPNLHYGQAIFGELSTVYVPDKTGFASVSLDKLSFDWQNIYCPRFGFQIKGAFVNGYSGPAIFYIVCRCFAQADVAHHRYLEAQKSMLDSYKDIPLDGFGWDEPAKGMSDMSCFKAGKGFLSLFKRIKKYDLKSKLIYLDHLDDTAEAIQVRTDYYQVLNDMNYRAQKAHNEYAEKIYGRKLYFGTHQTWSGLPADMAGGTIDYFQHGKVLSAAWTDGSWEVDLKYPSFHFLLADGIRNELGLEDAYYNDWGMTIPVIEDMRFANRFKMLYHVNWFNIFFSDFSESLINWRLEPARSVAKAEVQALDQFNELLEGLPAHSDVGWLYLWEGMAAAPKWLSRIWYTSSGNTAHHLADAGLFGSMIGPESLRKAHIENGQVVCGSQRFKTLIVPYAYAMAEDVFRKLLDIAKQQIPVVFYGPPPSFTLDGKSIRKTFAELVGIKPFTLADYQQAYSAKSPLPDLNEWEPEAIDFLYPVSVTDGMAERNSEGEILHVRGKDVPLYFMTGADPREDISHLLFDLVGTPVDAYADHTYCRVFMDSKQSGRKVVLTAAHGRIADAPLVPSRLVSLGGLIRRKKLQLKALVRLDGGELIVSGGTWCAVALEKGRVTGLAGDAPQVLWNGENINCEQ